MIDPILEKYYQAYIDEGAICVPVDGKRPKLGQYRGLTESVALTEDLKGFALLVGNGKTRFLVVDPDKAKNGEKTCGLNTLQTLNSDLNLDLENESKYVVKTGGGGLHIYFKLPDHIDGQMLAEKLEDKYPKIDFKSKKNGVVVAAGSIHPSGNRYEVVKGSIAEVGEAPKALIELLLKSNHSNSQANKKQQTNDNDVVHVEIRDYSKYPIDWVEEMLNKHCDADCSYDEYLSLHQEVEDYATVTNQCVKVKEMFKKWCAQSPKFDDSEFESTWASFGRKDGENRRTFASFIQRVNEAEKVEVYDLASKFVFVDKLNRWFNLETRKSYSITSFNLQFTKQFRSVYPDYKGKAHEIMMYVDDAKVASDIVYNPTKSAIFETFDRYHAKNIVYNTFNPDSVPKGEEITEEGQHWITNSFEKHILNLCEGDENLFQIMMSWFAWQVQRMGEQVRWMPLIIGSKGIGKNYLADTLKALLGSNNIGEPSNDTLASNFNGYAEGAAINVISEFKQSKNTNRQNLEMFKTLITEDRIEIQRKGLDGALVDNVTNYIAFSNEFNALYMDSSKDRRVFLLHPKGSPDDFAKNAGFISAYAYYKSLKDGLKRFSKQLRTYFEQYEISDEFLRSTGGQAPQTKYMESMFAANKSSIEGMEKVEELLESESGLYNSKVIVFSDLFDDLRRTPSLSHLKSNALSRILAKLGYHHVPFRPRLKNKQRTVWVSDASLSNVEIVKILERMVEEDRSINFD